MSENLTKPRIFGQPTVHDGESTSVASPDVDAFEHHAELANLQLVSKGQALRAEDYLNRAVADKLSDSELENLGDGSDLNKFADIYLSFGPTSRLEGAKARSILVGMMALVAGAKSPRALGAKLEAGALPQVSVREAALAGLIAYDLYESGMPGTDTYKALAKRYCSQARYEYQQGRQTLVSEEKQKETQGTFTDSTAYDCVSSAIVNMRFEHLFESEKDKDRHYSELLKFVREDVSSEKKEGFKYELLVFAIAQKILIDGGHTDEYSVKLANLRQDASSKNSGPANWKFNHDLIVERLSNNSSGEVVNRVQLKSNGKKPNLSKKIKLLSRDLSGRVEVIREAFEKILFSGEESLTQTESDLLQHEIDAIEKVVFS